MSLDGGRRALLLEALRTVVLVRAGLWLLPFRTLHGFVGRRASSPATERPLRHSVEDIAWAVEAASRRVPRATCLTQALAGTLLLAAHGHAATLRVGVARSDDGEFRAHAWIESEGEAVLGDPRTDSFVPLPPLAFHR